MGDDRDAQNMPPKEPHLPRNHIFSKGRRKPRFAEISDKIGCDHRHAQRDSAGDKGELNGNQGKDRSQPRTGIE